MSEAEQALPPELADKMATVKVRALTAEINRRRAQLQQLALAVVIQAGGLMAIWWRWEAGLSLALLAGIVLCVGLAADHGRALKKLEPPKPEG